MHAHLLSFKNCATAMPLFEVDSEVIFFYDNGKITVLLLQKKNCTLDEEPKAEEPKAEKQRKYQITMQIIKRKIMKQNAE